MEIINVQPNSQEWLQQRKDGLGGSDCAAALGVSKYKTPYQLWLDKTSQAPEQEDNDAMFWGRALEEPIRQKYSNLTDRKVTIPHGIIRNSKYPFMLASVDGITDDNRLFEAKTAAFPDGWGEPYTDEIPEAYLLQVQHYMAVTGIGVTDVAVLIGGRDFRLYEIPADKELQQIIIDGEAAFWDKVLNKIEPELIDGEDVVLKYKVSKGMAIEATDSIAFAAGELKGINTQRKNVINCGIAIFYCV